MWIQVNNHPRPQMNPIKTLFVIAALTVSSLAMAGRVVTGLSHGRKWPGIIRMESYRVAQTQNAQHPVAESKAKAMDHKN